MQKRTTDELNTELTATSSLKQFLEENTAHFREPGFNRLLSEQIRASGISKADLAKAAGMSEVYLHQILSGRRKPSRIKTLCLCIGMKLTLEETQKFLQSAGMATLYPRSRWDAIIIYGISRGKDLFAINDLLFDADEDTMI